MKIISYKHQSSFKTDTPWVTSGCQALKECSLADDTVPVVFISLIARAKIYRLMEELKGSEWLAYLVGRFNEADPPDSGGSYRIEDLYIPVQEVTSTSVDVEEGAGATMPENIIGTVHSHHSMGAFLSSTDHTYIGANHNVTIVTSDKEWKTTVRMLLPCGNYKITDSNLSYLLPRTNIEGWTQEALSKIKKKVYSYLPSTAQTTRDCLVCGMVYSYSYMTWAERGGTKGWICDHCLKDPTKQPKKEKGRGGTYKPCDVCDSWFPPAKLTYSTFYQGSLCPQCTMQFNSGMYDM